MIHAKPLDAFYTHMLSEKKGHVRSTPLLGGAFRCDRTPRTLSHAPHTSFVPPWTILLVTSPSQVLNERSTAIAE